MAIGDAAAAEAAFVILTVVTGVGEVDVTRSMLDTPLATGTESEPCHCEDLVILKIINDFVSDCLR